MNPTTPVIAENQRCFRGTQTMT